MDENLNPLPEKPTPKRKPKNPPPIIASPVTMQKWQEEIVRQIDQNFFFNVYGREQESMYLPEHAHSYPQPVTRETLENARRVLDGRGYVAAGEEPRSFLSPRIEHQIHDWSRADHRVMGFWHMLTRRVRRGLNDEIVNGVLAALSVVLKEADQERDYLNTRNLDNIRGLGNAVYEAVMAFRDAESRGDIEYMREAMEELEEALHATTGKEISEPEGK